MELAADDPQARANIVAFQRGLHTLGWLEGSNLAVDYRWAPDDAVLTRARLIDLPAEWSRQLHRMLGLPAR